MLLYYICKKFFCQQFSPLLSIKSVILSIAVVSLFMDVAYEHLTCPAPADPNAPPGTTATFLLFKSSLANLSPSMPVAPTDGNA